MLILALVLVGGPAFPRDHDHGGDHPHPHHHGYPQPGVPHYHVHPPVMAQGSVYVAICSRNDLYVRCGSFAEARRVAADHAARTGHPTGVSKQ